MGQAKLKKEKEKLLLKLDLGCGESAKEGFTGVDLYALSANEKLDLMKFPWPWLQETVSEVYCSHFLEHVPGKLRPQFMDELWRVLVPEGVATIIVPYWSSARSIQDPTHEWPPLAESSFFYFNKKWREDNKLGHYLGTCDFDFTYGCSLDPETAVRSEESKMFQLKHYLNAGVDMQVIMTKKVR